MKRNLKASFTVEASFFSIVVIMLLLSLMTYIFFVYDRLSLAQGVDRGLLWAFSEQEEGKEISEQDIKERVEREKGLVFLAREIDYQVEIEGDEKFMEYSLEFGNIPSVFRFRTRVRRHRRVNLPEMRLREERRRDQHGS